MRRRSRYRDDARRFRAPIGVAPGGGRRFWVSGTPALARPYEAEGADGLYRSSAWAPSAARAGQQIYARVRSVDTRYWDFTAQALPREDGGRSRLQAHTTAWAELQAHGRGGGCPYGQNRPKAAPCPVCMMMPRTARATSGSPVDVGPDRHPCEAISTRPSSSPKRAPCRSARCRGRSGQRTCSSYADRASHYWIARGRSRWTRTPRRSAAPQARHRVDPGILGGKGALGAVSTVQKACPRNSGCRSPTWSRPTASSRRSSATHRGRLTPAEDRGTAFVPFTGFWRHPVHPRGTHLQTTTRRWQATGSDAAGRPPHDYVNRRSASTPGNGLFHGAAGAIPRRGRRWRQANPRGRVTRFVRDTGAGQVDRSLRAKHFPTGRRPHLAVNHMVHQAVSSECSVVPDVV